MILAKVERVLEKLALGVRLLLAKVERVLEKLALGVRLLLAEVERVLAVLVLAVPKSLQNPMPLCSFTDIVKLSQFTFQCIKSRR
jgi:hypothetical protein